MKSWTIPVLMGAFFMAFIGFINYAVYKMEQTAPATPCELTP